MRPQVREPFRVRQLIASILTLAFLVGAVVALAVFVRRGDQLLNEPELAKLTKRLQDTAGTPAAWSAGAMSPAGRRSAAVRDLVEALRETGTPVTD
jgi:uncharacterized membrane protein